MANLALNAITKRYPINVKGTNESPFQYDLFRGFGKIAQVAATYATIEAASRFSDRFGPSVIVPAGGQAARERYSVKTIFMTTAGIALVNYLISDLPEVVDNDLSIKDNNEMGKYALVQAISYLPLMALLGVAYSGRFSSRVRRYAWRSIPITHVTSQIMIDLMI
jgi:hypothetical protein